MALATDNCKKATKCSEMKDDKDKCSSFSDCTCQSPSEIVVVIVKILVGIKKVVVDLLAKDVCLVC